MPQEWLTPPQLAEEIGVHADRVRGWIATGELRAVNLADSKARPRWRIHREAIEAFLAGRSNAPAADRPRRRRKSLGSTTEFF